MTKATEFLKSHKMTAADIDMQQVVDVFLSEMNAGLAGSESSLRMIPTYIETDNELVPNQKVVAIDAGGTNFRTATVYFDDNLKMVCENLKNGRMPAIDQELGKKEFFETMAGYLEEYKNAAEKIGFCFSYAVEIFPDKDGKLLEWSKEIKAPEVIGEMVGRNLLEAMGTPGKPLVVLNDTVATLLAGKAATAGKKYDTYIGFILGTGTNTAYIELNDNIVKTSGLHSGSSQVINIESGAFGNPPRTDIDLLFDSQTKNPGRYVFEKMFSGGYFGGLCTTALKQAAKEGVFSVETTSRIIALTELTSEEVNKFVSGIDPDQNQLSFALLTDEDRTEAEVIVEGMIERASKLVAANLAAVILKTGKAKSSEKPVLMTIEGTTFYKLKDFQVKFEKYLQEYLSGENQRYYEIVEVANSSLIGAAIAAIVN
jgi:hexokinase